MNCVIDELSYRSWWYQINWYNMDKVKARKLYSDWEKFEKRYEEEKIRGNRQESPNHEATQCFIEKRINQ